MKYLKALILLTLPMAVFAQNTDFKLQESKLLTLKQSVTNSGNLFDTVTATKETTKTYGSKKSPFLALIYGLAIPGMGHVYANRFNTGKYFMISEAAIWLTYAAFTIYGNWLIDDAYDFSTTHAGVTVTGKEKDDIFFVNVANYNNVEEYNNEKLRFGEYDKVYLPGTGYDFYWDSFESRLKYRENKIGGDRILNDRLFVIGAVLINHLVSGISAVFAANGYNSDLKQKGSGGFTVRAGVQKHFNKIDGIKLNITKWF